MRGQLALRVLGARLACKLLGRTLDGWLAQKVVARLMGFEQRLEPLAQHGVAGAGLIQVSRPLRRRAYFECVCKDRLFRH
jgi:hypothetical protein